MPFTVLPAVDVSAGRTARLDPGAADGDLADGIASGRPLDAALAWQADGAEWIHLVDLDAAFGRGSNAALLAAVVGALDIDVELSGGICDEASLQRALSTGCARVNLATTSLRDPAWCARAIGVHGERIAVCLDVRADDSGDGTVRHRLAARGGDADTGDVRETIAWLDGAGCARSVVTDVGRDGMLSGVDVDLYRTIARATTAHVIASGGVASIDDLVALADAAASHPNLEGAIVGRALHAGRFTLADALAAVG